MRGRLMITAEMKLLTLVLLTLAAPLAYAQDTYREMSTDQAMELYAGITAGWFINQNCKFLSAEESGDLQKNWGTVMQELKKTWNADFFPLVENTSKDVAADKPYKKCGREAREAVLDAVRLSKEWAAEFTSQASSAQ
jgi:hypothetical protein